MGRRFRQTTSSISTDALDYDRDRPRKRAHAQSVCPMLRGMGGPLVSSLVSAEQWQPQLVLTFDASFEVAGIRTVTVSVVWHLKHASWRTNTMRNKNGSWRLDSSPRIVLSCYFQKGYRQAAVYHLRRAGLLVQDRTFASPIPSFSTTVTTIFPVRVSLIGREPRSHQCCS
jgi:hypothetical protein